MIKLDPSNGPHPLAAQCYAKGVDFCYEHDLPVTSVRVACSLYLPNQEFSFTQQCEKWFCLPEPGFPAAWYGTREECDPQEKANAEVWLEVEKDRLGQEEAQRLGFLAQREDGTWVGEPFLSKPSASYATAINDVRRRLVSNFREFRISDNGGGYYDPTLGACWVERRQGIWCVYRLDKGPYADPRKFDSLDETAHGDYASQHQLLPLYAQQNP